MTVVLKMSTGDSHLLDRRLSLHEVVEKVNKTRNGGYLIEFQDNRTPSRPIHIDPDEVISIQDDGYTY